MGLSVAKIAARLNKNTNTVAATLSNRRQYCTRPYGHASSITLYEGSTNMYIAGISKEYSEQDIVTKPTKRKKAV